MGQLAEESSELDEMHSKRIWVREREEIPHGGAAWNQSA